MYLFASLWTTSSLCSLAVAAPKHKPHGSKCELTTAKSQQVVSDYLHIWNTGDFSTVPQVLAPNMHYYQDRLPTGTGNGSIVFPISNFTQWEAFVTEARKGWQSYTFTILYQFFEGNQIAARWRHDETSNHTGASENIPAGTVVSFNGTDLITVDCSGLIIEVDSAQDYITDYHNLQIPLGTV